MRRQSHRPATYPDSDSAHTLIEGQTVCAAINFVDRTTDSTPGTVGNSGVIRICRGWYADRLPGLVQQSPGSGPGHDRGSGIGQVCGYTTSDGSPSEPATRARIVVIVLTLLRSNPVPQTRLSQAPSSVPTAVDDAIETARAFPWSVAPWPTHLAGRIITGTACHGHSRSSAVISAATARMNLRVSSDAIQTPGGAHMGGARNTAVAMLSRSSWC